MNIEFDPTPTLAPPLKGREHSCGIIICAALLLPLQGKGTLVAEQKVGMGVG